MTVLEVDYVITGWRDHHSDGERINDQPLIPDVAGLDLNQMFLGYSQGIWRLRLGRQAIALDDQRFVGGNGFWQNEQTFDALRLQWRWRSASRLHYVYIANANRIYGEAADAEDFPAPPGRPAGFLGDHEHRSHLLHFEMNEWDAAQWQLYFYWIDNLDQPASSNHTLGTQYAYNLTLGPVKYAATLALAGQERPGVAGSPVPLYGLAELGAIRGAWRGVLRYEMLDSDARTTFATPLASGHDFQGWADVFVQTPDSGLQDASAELHWRGSPWEIDLRYHAFWEARSGGEHLGDEWDVEVEFKPTRRQILSLRYGDFQTDSAAYPDTRKIFLNYSYGF